MTAKPKRKKATTRKKAGAKKPAVNQKRFAKNREINQQLLREKLAAGHHHVDIVKALGECGALYAELKEITELEPEERAAYDVRLSALRLFLDGKFRLLAKYLPDQKQLVDGDGNNPLAVIGAAWAKALDEEPL